MATNENISFTRSLLLLAYYDGDIFHVRKKNDVSKERTDEKYSMLSLSVYFYCCYLRSSLIFDEENDKKQGANGPRSPH
jgi:hypothetical protein